MKFLLSIFLQESLNKKATGITVNIFVENVEQFYFLSYNSNEQLQMNKAGEKSMRNSLYTEKKIKIVESVFKKKPKHF